MANRLPRFGRLLAHSSIMGIFTRPSVSRTFPVRSVAPTSTFFPMRTYSSDNDDSERQGKAFAFQIMNPFKYLKVRLGAMYIQSRIDGEFTLESFLFGATQAFKVLLQCLTKNDYGSLEGLVTKEAMEWLRHNYHGADPDLDFNLNNDEMVIRKPKNIDVTELDDMNRVHVDALFAGIKIKEKPYMITGLLRFQRDYRKGHHSDWIISEIQQLVVKEVGSISF